MYLWMVFLLDRGILVSADLIIYGHSILTMMLSSLLMPHVYACIVLELVTDIYHGRESFEHSGNLLQIFGSDVCGCTGIFTKDLRC